jgi:DNA-binding NarL/FixJ family response regulator
MIIAKDKKVVEREVNLLSLEVAEIRDISDIIFRRIENKIRALNEIEASVDRKITSLEQLIQRAEHINQASSKVPARVPTGGMTRQQEVVALKQRGLKAGEIAGTLHMPVGEVQMILGLHQQA